MARRLSPRDTGDARRALPWRRAALVLLTVFVALVHAWITRDVAVRMADFSQSQALPPRMEVAYVREMEVAATAPVPPAPPPAREPVAAMPAEPGASAPVQKTKKKKREKKDKEDKRAPAEAVASAANAAASAPPPQDAPAATMAAASAASDAASFAEAASAPAMAEAASAPMLAAASAPPPASAPDAAASSAALASAAPAASAPPGAASTPPGAADSSGTAGGTEVFEWPVSTRVSYTLTGNYRGEIKGSAQVEWVRAGSHYQVHLDFLVGPKFAPVVQRRMSSDGEIRDAGLYPARYDEETKVMFGDWRRRSILFEPDAVRLPNGQRPRRLRGVQDTASQFVQLTYLFSTGQARLRVGETVEIPLALAHKVDTWIYDVVAEETVHTAFGALQAFHLKPRRPPDPGSNTLAVEIWFAPQLRYLPVRLYVTQDAQNYADLVIDRRPEMAAPARP